MTKIVISLLAACFLAAGASAQIQSPLGISLEPFIVSEVTTADGAVEERFFSADSARPQQVIEYRLSLRNDGSQSVAPGLVALGPIPEGTVYLDGTATEAAEFARTEFSADGGQTFSEAPLLITVVNQAGEEEEVVAEPEQYSAVRWIILDGLEPDQELLFIYRVKVE